MSRHLLKTTFLIALAVSFFQAALAQTQNNTASPAKPPKTCSMPEHRQFDFWIGDWDVQVSGQPAGTNTIQLILDGCVLQENWTGSKGGTGKSFNFYDSAKGKWQQTWVDNTGQCAGALWRIQGRRDAIDRRKHPQRKEDLAAPELFSARKRPRAPALGTVTGRRQNLERGV